MIRLVTLLILLLAVGLAFPSHGHWVDAYTDHNGTSCCLHAQDCHPAPVALVTQDATTATVLVHGTPLVLPRASVHWSQDGDSWLCTRSQEVPMPLVASWVRCAFLAVGG